MSFIVGFVVGCGCVGLFLLIYTSFKHTIIVKFKNKKYYISLSEDKHNNRYRILVNSKWTSQYLCFDINYDAKEMKARFLEAIKELINSKQQLILNDPSTRLLKNFKKYNKTSIVEG